MGENENLAWMIGFYVKPTTILREQINIRRRAPGKDGKSRLAFGLCTLRLRQHRSGEERVDYGFDEKWKPHLDDWKCLDGGEPVLTIEVKSEPGPPMIFGKRGGCRSCGASPSGSLAFGEPHGFSGSHTASPGAGNAAIRLSPLRRHFVPPKVARVPIPAR